MSIKEIAVRLRDLGIDLIHNRFLILQVWILTAAVFFLRSSKPLKARRFLLGRG